MTDIINWGDHASYGLDCDLDTMFTDFAGYYDLDGDAAAQQSAWGACHVPSSYWLAGSDGSVTDFADVLLGWHASMDSAVGAYTNSDYLGALMPMESMW